MKVNLSFTYFSVTAVISNMNGKAVEIQYMLTHMGKNGKKMQDLQLNFLTYSVNYISYK